MKLWDISRDGSFCKVQLEVKDLGGHLDFTRRARAGTLSKRVGEATVGVAAVGALPLGFQVKLGLVRGKYLLAGLHAESSYVSSSSISAFRAAIVRAVWSTKMSLVNTPVILDLLDGPVGVDPAFHVVWAGFSHDAQVAVLSIFSLSLLLRLCLLGMWGRRVGFGFLFVI